jgi:hypothetical protein
MIRPSEKICISLRGNVFFYHIKMLIFPGSYLPHPEYYFTSIVANA